MKQVRKQAEELIDTGQLQEARRLLKKLASETVISVANIPLATYPDAIKAAVKLIDQNKKNEAKRVLQSALNTQAIAPLPQVRPTSPNTAAPKRARQFAASREFIKDNEAAKILKRSNSLILEANQKASPPLTLAGFTQQSRI